VVNIICPISPAAAKTGLLSSFFFPHSRRGVGAGPYGPEAEFPYPSSVFRRPPSIFRRPPSAIRHPSSVIRRPSSFFPIPHSEFRIPHSEFRIPNSLAQTCFIRIVYNAPTPLVFHFGAI